jgi:AraC-like DNA-binding protein
VLLLESDEVLRQAQNLDKLQAKAKGYLEQLATQRTITLMSLILLGLLILVLVLFYLYHRNKVKVQRERMVSNLWNMEIPAESSEDDSRGVGSEECEVRNDDPQSNLTPPSTLHTPQTEEPLFLVRFKDVVEAHLSNSDITVDDLAAAMNLSRVQLYRKVKAISGSSPNELLRTARLNRGYQLLLTTDKNISEVAYEVGFTAPSYFTKCFKDEFGVSPSDINCE